MKNKLISSIIVATLLVGTQAIASDWWTNYRDENGSANRGIAIRLGTSANNPKGMKNVYDQAADSYGVTEKELTKRNGYVGLETLYELQLNEETNKLGVKIGVEIYGQNELELKGSYNSNFISAKGKENTYAVPITFYYKRDNGVKKLSWMAGAGVTIMRSEVEIKSNFTGNEKYSKTKAFPHIMVGAEYRFSKLFALGLEARYNIAAKIKKGAGYLPTPDPHYYLPVNGILSDRSGFSGAVTGRFYF